MQHLIGSISPHLASLVGNNILLAYLPVFIGTIFLGNLAAFSSLWLAFHGTFGPWGVGTTIFVLFLADVTADFLWYSLGRLLSGTKLGNFIERHLPGSTRIQKYLHKNATRMIFLSKFLYSSSFVILFSVGWARIDFKKFFRVSVIAVAVWLPFITFISFALFQSLSLVHAESMSRRLEILFLGSLVAFILLNQALKFILRIFLGKRETKEKEEVL